MHGWGWRVQVGCECWWVRSAMVGVRECMVACGSMVGVRVQVVGVSAWWAS